MLKKIVNNKIMLALTSVFGDETGDIRLAKTADAEASKSAGIWFDDDGRHIHVLGYHQPEDGVAEPFMAKYDMRHLKADAVLINKLNDSFPSQVFTSGRTVNNKLLPKDGALELLIPGILGVPCSELALAIQKKKLNNLIELKMNEAKALLV